MATVQLLDTTKRNFTFEMICRRSQDDLWNLLISNGFQAHDGVLVHEGKLPICLTAHLDTVHNELVSDVIYCDGLVYSPQGIGGDDRCGVYMILEILKKYDPWVIFCRDEEVGSVGASKFIKTQYAKNLIGKFNYMIELDRANKNDAVFYELDNKNFEDFILKDGSFKHNWGTWSDICELAPFFGCAAVNLSCGYYKPHTLNEYVNLEEMYSAIKNVKNLIARSDLTQWKWIRKQYTYKNYHNYSTGVYDYYDDYCGGILYIVLKTKTNDVQYINQYGLSMENAYLKVSRKYPWLSYDMIATMEYV